ncbi:hypothetical protein L1887_32118 [Cichorium endivia]|nr:hypothetical protein L1887_32118 [Cichorium endivia]
MIISIIVISVNLRTHDQRHKRSPRYGSSLTFSRAREAKNEAKESRHRERASDQDGIGTGIGVVCVQTMHSSSAIRKSLLPNREQQEQSSIVSFKKWKLQKKMKKNVKNILFFKNKIMTGYILYEYEGLLISDKKVFILGE